MYNKILSLYPYLTTFHLKIPKYIDKQYYLNRFLTFEQWSTTFAFIYVFLGHPISRVQALRNLDFNLYNEHVQVSS